MAIIGVVDTKDPTEILADQLQEIVDRLRSGETQADQAVIVLRNERAGRMFRPHHFGSPISSTGILGMLSYAQMHFFATQPE